MSSALKQIAYAFSPFTRAAGSTVSSVNGMVSKALENNGKYVVKDDKEFAELPFKLLYSTLARFPGWQAAAAQEYSALQKMIGAPNNFSVQQWSSVGLFAAELYLWFKVGEIVGRPSHTILGYEVKPPCPVCGTRKNTAGLDGPLL